MQPALLEVIIMKVLRHSREVFRIKYTNTCMHAYHVQRTNTFSLTIFEYTCLTNLFQMVP